MAHSSADDVGGWTFLYFVSKFVIFMSHLNAMIYLLS